MASAMVENPRRLRIALTDDSPAQLDGAAEQRESLND